MVRKSQKDMPDLSGKNGARLSNKKWYNYIVHTQLFLFAAVQLILGVYLAFVSTEYANTRVYTAKLDSHQKLDQIFAIACFVMAGMALNVHGKMKKIKKIPVRYFVYMGISAVLPLAYMLLSNMIVGNEVAEAIKPELADMGMLAANGDARAEYVVYCAGLEMGSWTPADSVTWDMLGAYLTPIGEKLFTWVPFSNIDISSIAVQMRNEMYGWDMYAMSSWINLGVSALFIACSILIPRQKKVQAPVLTMAVEEAPVEEKNTADCEQ